MMRILAASSLALALGGAPLQCRHDPDPDLRREDSAGDALYALAEDFKAKGNTTAADQTLRFLVERYPSNRHVPAARDELRGAAAGRPRADASAGETKP